MSYTDDLNKQIQQQEREYLEKIKTDIESLFRKAIEDTVYSYSPVIEYHRTEQLLNSVSARINSENELYVFCDYNTHFSAVDGRSTGLATPYFIENGHFDGKGTGKYHSYEGTHFLEKAKELIQQKYPELKHIEIINDEPPRV